MCSVIVSVCGVMVSECSVMVNECERIDIKVDRIEICGPHPYTLRHSSSDPSHSQQSCILDNRKHIQCIRSCSFYYLCMVHDSERV